MSKKISKAIRDSEEYLHKMKKDLPIELNGIIDFLLKAATIDIDDDFFDKTFPTEQLDPAKYQWFNGKRYAKQETGYYRQSHKTFIHRDIWEYYNGKIPKGYVVHHKDFNPSNNDIENLVLLTYAEHKQLHMSLTETKKFICDCCGKEFESYKYKKVKYCSKKCSSTAMHKKRSKNLKSDDNDK